jgi:hypothetical protein
MGAGIQRASELKPRPNLIFVFTDGETGWPDRPPPKTKVIVGVINELSEYLDNVPSWAKGVSIDFSDDD